MGIPCYIRPLVGSSSLLSGSPCKNVRFCMDTGVGIMKKLTFGANLGMSWYPAGVFCLAVPANTGPPRVVRGGNRQLLHSTLPGSVAKIDDWTTPRGVQAADWQLLSRIPLCLIGSGLVSYDTSLMYSRSSKTYAVERPSGISKISLRPAFTREASISVRKDSERGRRSGSSSCYTFGFLQRQRQR